MKTMLAIAAALVAAVLALGPMSTQITAYAQDIGDVWETEMKSENEQIELENEQIELENEQIELENEQIEESENEQIEESENEHIESENEQTGETEMETEDSQITIRLPGTTNFEFP
jgi:hypothetical protein